MHAILADLEAVPKTHQVEARGQGASYRFRGIDDAINALNPLLAKHGVYFYPRVLKHRLRYTERTNSSGFSVEWTRAKVTVDYCFVAASDGSTLHTRVVAEGLDNSDKATAKALSQALKYCLLQTFAIATADMEDQDATRPEPIDHLTAPRQHCADGRAGG